MLWISLNIIGLYCLREMKLNGLMYRPCRPSVCDVLSGPVWLKRFWRNLHETTIISSSLPVCGVQLLVTLAWCVYVIKYAADRNVLNTSCRSAEANILSSVHLFHTAIRFCWVPFSIRVLTLTWRFIIEMRWLQYLTNVIQRKLLMNS